MPSTGMAARFKINMLQLSKISITLSSSYQNTRIRQRRNVSDPKRINQFFSIIKKDELKLK